VHPGNSLAIVAHSVGVRYNLSLTSDRTLRRTIAATIRHPGRRKGNAFWALRDVGFVVEPGEIVGVIGRNGSGKSTLLLSVAGIIPPDVGSIRTFGRTSTLLTLGAGFEPELSGRENIRLNGAYLGLPRQVIEERLDEIVEFSELGGFIDAPVKKYSTGMRARLGFSIAAHVEPEILLLDETLGVGDAGFQEKSRDKLLELMGRSRAIMVVSHSMQFVQETCTKALWLEDGRVAGFGEPHDVVAAYAAAANQPERAIRAVS
jgi:ABC-type polysaccharide/polyol phosphate transport system ATPase subunit